jgi:hypothetical protein
VATFSQSPSPLSLPTLPQPPSHALHKFILVRKREKYDLRFRLLWYTHPFAFAAYGFCFLITCP